MSDTQESNAIQKPSNKKKEKKRTKTVEETKKVIPPRGLPKSGRVWKTQKEKFSKVLKSHHGKPKEKHLKLREDIRRIKEISRTIKEERKQQGEMKKQRREENTRRRLENERKAEIVQIIKNPAKLKRMRKKQLRQIEKRDFSQIKAV